MRRKEIKIIAFSVLVCMMCGSVFATVTTPAGQTAAPTQVPRPTPTPTPTPTPSTQPNEKKDQPFILDNFKVIEMTLNHFGVDSIKLANYIKQGKKLEDVLKAEKISVKKFKKQVVEEYFKAVQEGIANEQLTEEQASQLKSAIKETVKGWLPRK